jgi:hypothetical protein
MSTRGALRSYLGAGLIETHGRQYTADSNADSVPDPAL